MKIIEIPVVQVNSFIKETNETLECLNRRGNEVSEGKIVYMNGQLLGFIPDRANKIYDVTEYLGLHLEPRIDTNGNIFSGANKYYRSMEDYRNEREVDVAFLVEKYGCALPPDDEENMFYDIEALEGCFEYENSLVDFYAYYEPLDYFIAKYKGWPLESYKDNGSVVYNFAGNIMGGDEGFSIDRKDVEIYYKSVKDYKDDKSNKFSVWVEMISNKYGIPVEDIKFKI